MKNTMASYKRWNICVLGGILFIFLIIGGTTVYLDPVFHYHAPLNGYAYPLDDERYQNDGIVRHFNYNAIITGTSMTENFKTSECDELFGMKEAITSIKVPFAGAPYKEINDNLERAFEANAEIKLVIRGLDYISMTDDKDAVWDGVRDYGYPEYLTNDNIFDDVQYLFNKEIFINKTLKVLECTQDGKSTTSFDDYMFWSDNMEYGKDVVLDGYERGERLETEREFTEEERIRMLDSLRQNVTDLVEQHPDVEFYIFFPPYSICYWDVLNQKGQINWRINAEKCAIEELLKHSNIKLFSFCTEYEMVCNLDNYRDKYHYGGWINSRMLEWMSKDIHLLTEENYQEYIENIREFYQSYDYDKLHK